MFKTTRILSLVILTLLSHSYAEPIKLHPSNPHYYLFNDRPTILITSAEHYGAVVNKDFDYVPYLDALKSYGLNYTRIYMGAMFETVGKFIKGNPLGPKPDALAVPWARSSAPGYLLCGNKFDLDQWDPEYFKRLKDFIAKAGDRSIVVEICFFNAQYSDTWPISPLYYENNIQGVGKCDFEDAQTLKYPELVAREADYVRKITEEVNSFDNIILEICDEPSLFTPVQEAGPWVGHLLEVVKNTESHLPKKHLLGQEVAGPMDGPVDFSGTPHVSVIVAQYVWQSGDEMGGMQALDLKYGHNKPIEFNETAWYPWGYQGDKIADSRVEAWEFIVGGGASFNQLNGLYTPKDSAGKTPENARICRALQSLKEFIYSFDFLKMCPDKSFVVGGIPAGTYCRGISQSGQQYALYLHHSTGGKGSVYTVTPGNYIEKLVLNLPAGSYKVDWVDPSTGSVVGTMHLTHPGGQTDFTTPEHSVDIALRIKHAY
jgi:hypothetical protein